MSSYLFSIGIVPSSLAAVKVTPSVPDKKTGVKVCGSDPGSEVSLNVGETVVEIEVTSADGSNKQVRDWLRKF